MRTRVFGLLVAMAMGGMVCAQPGASEPATKPEQTPAKSPEQRGMPKRYGLQFLIVDGAGPVLRESRPGSRAARAGLKDGDRVMKVNGAEVSGVDQQEFVRLMKQSPVTLTLSRGGKTMDVTMSLDDPEDPTPLEIPAGVLGKLKGTYTIHGKQWRGPEAEVTEFEGTATWETSLGRYAHEAYVLRFDDETLAGETFLGRGPMSGCEVVQVDAASPGATLARGGWNETTREATLERPQTALADGHTLLKVRLVYRFKDDGFVREMWVTLPGGQEFRESEWTYVGKK
jgi:hypothetical protein